MRDGRRWPGVRRRPPLRTVGRLTDARMRNPPESMSGQRAERELRGALRRGCDEVAVIEYRVLGPVEVLQDGLPVDLGGHRERALLALLLLTPNDVVPADELVEELWEGSPPAHGAANLRVHVSRLRKALGSEVVQTKTPGYRLVVDRDSVDVLVFQAEVRQAHDLADAAAAGRLLRQALERWRGRAFADVTGPPAVNACAARLDESRLSVIEDRVAADLACGRHLHVAAELEELTKAYPLRERLWELRVLALYRCGRQAEALSAYQALRVMLLEEHGLEPNPSLRRLELAILNQDPPWTGSRLLTAPEPCRSRLP